MGVEWVERGRGREREWVDRLMFAGLEAEALGGTPKLVPSLSY
jgi:hypothetical protein